MELSVFSPAVRHAAVFSCLPRAQQRWSRSRWTRSLAARGTWWSARASALRSRTKWRTCSTCSSEAAWPCVCGSALSSWLCLLASDVVTRPEMRTSSPARHRLHIPARLAGHLLPSHSVYLSSHLLFSFPSSSAAVLFSVHSVCLRACVSVIAEFLQTMQPARVSNVLYPPFSSGSVHECAWSRLCVRDTHSFWFLNRISPPTVQSPVFFSLRHACLSINFLIFCILTRFGRISVIFLQGKTQNLMSWTLNLIHQDSL